MGFMVRMDEDHNYGFDGRLMIGETEWDGRLVRVAKPITLEFVEFVPRTPTIEPTLMLPHGQMRELFRAFMEEMVRKGLMPAQPLEGELKATKFHLEDMRRLVHGRGSDEERKPTR
jgi:hypothetical protein